MPVYLQGSKRRDTPPVYSDCQSFSNAKTTLIAPKYSPGTTPECQILETSQPPTLPHLQEWLTFSLVDSLVKTSQEQGQGQELTGVGPVYGDTIAEQSTTYVLDTQLLKTLPDLRAKGLTKSYATLMPAGIMQNGSIYRLENSGPVTTGKEYGYLPTPLATDGRAYYVCSRASAIAALKRRSIARWMAVAVIWSNLQKAMANPRFSEYMMGLPVDYTYPTDSKP